MQTHDFCLWLKGVITYGNLHALNEAQVLMIRDQLNSVFIHDIDPKMGDQAHQERLTKLHGGGKHF